MQGFETFWFWKKIWCVLTILFVVLTIVFVVLTIVFVVLTILFVFFFFMYTNSLRKSNATLYTYLALRVPRISRTAHCACRATTFLPKNGEHRFFCFFRVYLRKEQKMGFVLENYFFFSPARGTGTERRPKAGAEWRCPAPEKKKQLNFQKAKPIFVFSETATKKTKESVFFLFKAKTLVSQSINKIRR